MYVLYYMGDYSVLYVWGPGVGGLYCIIERIILDLGGIILYSGGIILYYRSDNTVLYWGLYCVILGIILYNKGDYTV